MKLIQIIVDDLPSNCRNCEIRNDNYCPLKGIKTGQQWIDKWSEFRDINCPLESR